MKAFTHYTFSAGASIYLLSVAGLLSLSSAVIALWLSFSVNYVIDAIGHTNRNGNPARTRLTHSLFTAPLWGALVPAVSFLLILQVASLSPLPTLVLWTTMGVMIAMGHLLLDSMTQAGVYNWKHRVAVAHFSYDNPAVNFGFVLLGIGLLAMTFAGVGLSFPVFQ